MTQFSQDSQPNSASLERIIHGFRQYQAEANDLQKQYLQDVELVRREFSQFANESSPQQKAPPEQEKLSSFWRKVIGTQHPVAAESFKLYRTQSASASSSLFFHC